MKLFSLTFSSTRTQRLKSVITEFDSSQSSNSLKQPEKAIEKSLQSEKRKSTSETNAARCCLSRNLVSCVYICESNVQ